MDRWVLIALDERSAEAMFELLYRYLHTLVELHDPRANDEFMWGAHLMLQYSTLEADAEAIKSAQKVLKLLRGALPSKRYEKLTRSRRLTSRTDWEWIEAQWRAGRLVKSHLDESSNAPSSD